MCALSGYTKQQQPKQPENNVIGMAWREREAVLSLWSLTQEQMIATTC